MPPNLTIPAAHVEVGTRALNAGKHVFSEKPLAVDFEQPRLLLGIVEADDDVVLRFRRRLLSFRH